MLKWAHFGNHSLPIMAQFDMPILVYMLANKTGFSMYPWCAVAHQGMQFPGSASIAWLISRCAKLEFPKCASFGM